MCKANGNAVRLIITYMIELATKTDFWCHSVNFASLQMEYPCFHQWEQGDVLFKFEDVSNVYFHFLLMRHFSQQQECKCFNST